MALPLIVGIDLFVVVVVVGNFSYNAYVGIAAATTLARCGQLKCQLDGAGGQQDARMAVGVSKFTLFKI